MKKLLFSLLLLLAAPVIASAQTVEITPFGGYVFPCRWYATGGNMYFLGNGQYGGMLSFGISRVMDVDLIYNRSDTKAQINIPGFKYDVVPLSINYFQIGGAKNFRINKIVSPFFGLNFGGCLAAPKTGAYNDQWFFSVGMNAGSKFYFTKRVGLRLQAQLYMPIQSVGYMFYVGSGGAGSGITLNSTLVQFGFTGGLIFRLGPVFP
ncbi:MAG: hypothetical protein M0Q38_09885 [Bacteroidales bacterium]|jgi:hypothetical protein|nr:hypothetical protein [Bacteroidales bacterium]